MGASEAASYDHYVIGLNYAILALTDEILRLPSGPAVVTAVQLLYGAGSILPERLIARAGRGVPLSLAPLLVAPYPIAALLPERLEAVAAWWERGRRLKGPGAIARQRYRQLLASLLAGEGHAFQAPAESLVHETYASGGRWMWSDAARRLLDRVVLVNRSVLSLLGAVSRGESPATLVLPRTFLESEHSLPDAALDALADALPPVAIPDFARLAQCLTSPASPVPADESIARYRSLFAEMLRLARPPEVLV